MKKAYLLLAALLTAGTLVSCKTSNKTTTSVFSRTTTTSEEKGPATCEDQDLYMRGSMNSWGAPEEYRITQKEEGSCIFTGHFELTVGDSFKFADDSWGSAYVTFADETQTNFELVGDGFGAHNISTLIAGVYDFEVDIDKDLITFTYSEPTKTATGTSVQYVIMGSFNSWQEEEMTAGEDGKYTADISFTSATAEFLCVKNDITTYSDDSTSTVKTYFKTASDSNFLITANGAYTVTLDPSATEDKVTWVKTGDTELAATVLYLRGINSWDPVDAQKFAVTTTENVYTLTFEITADDVGKEFKVSDTSWTGSNTFDFSTLTVLDGEFVACEEASNTNIKIAKAGTYTFTATIAAEGNTLTYTVA